MYLIFLGAPGAGKGTQAAVVSRELGVEHVASGDLFRKAQAGGDELGRQVKSYMEKGLLVPDETTIRIIQAHMDRCSPEQGFLLDGFPRTLEQAKALDNMLTLRHTALDRAVYIEVKLSELTARLNGRLTCRQCQAPYHRVSSPPQVEGLCDKCGGELYQRADDAPETVSERLRVYFEQTSPLIAYYRSAGKLLEVNGTQAIEKVTEDIIASLNTSPGQGRVIETPGG
ncbi:adenylate kinase [Chloroflexota bacterium]